MNQSLCKRNKKISPIAILLNKRFHRGKWYYLIFDFHKTADNKDNTTAAAIPPAQAVKPPVKIPNMPCSATASLPPLARRFQKPNKGTDAPAPAKSTNF